MRWINMVKKRLIGNFKKVVATKGMTKTHWLLRRIDLLKLLDLQKELEILRKEQYYIYTDNMGSFFNSSINMSELIY